MQEQLKISAPASTVEGDESMQKALAARAGAQEAIAKARQNLQEGVHRSYDVNGNLLIGRDQSEVRSGGEKDRTTAGKLA